MHMMKNHHEKITLTLGLRNCGKSESVENQLNNKKHKLYIGTLWTCKDHSKTILRHQRRRDRYWTLYESDGKLIDDFYRINEILSKKIYQACLIDGLSTWALHCSLKSGSININAYNVAQTICKLILRYPHIEWFLVDVLPEAFTITDNKVMFRVCKDIHFLLKSNIKNLKIIIWKGNYNG